MPGVKVVLADDHAMMRDGLRALLERAGVEVLGEAANGHQAIEEARRVRPDVVVMDVGMPQLNGIHATRRIAAEMPRVKVVGLSMNADRRYVIAMLEAGAVAYLLKNSASVELLTALQIVLAGGTFVSPAVAGAVDPSTYYLGAARPALDRPLSPREREVVKLIAEGKSSKEIAVALGIAVTTIETHRRQLMEKLGLHTIAELTKYAIREGLTSGDR